MRTQLNWARHICAVLYYTILYYAQGASTTTDQIYICPIYVSDIPWGAMRFRVSKCVCVCVQENVSRVLS